jgi:hypothetical protein
MRELSFAQARSIFMKRLKLRSNTLPESDILTESVIGDVDFLLVYYVYRETPNIRQAIVRARKSGYEDDMIDAMKSFYKLASSMNAEILAQAVIEAILDVSSVLEQDKVIGDRV